MNLSHPEIALEVIASSNSSSNVEFRTTKHSTEKELKKIIRRFIDIKNKKDESENLIEVLS